MSSAEENIEAVRRLYEALNNSDPNLFVEVVDNLMIPEITMHGDAHTPFVIGRDSYKQMISMVKGAFPDITATIQLIFAEQNKVVLREEVHATHENAWMGVPATYKKVRWTATSIIRFNNEGKMAERWVMEDQLTRLQQLGVVARIPGQLGYVG